jgi:hypothetical protein
MHKKIYYAFFLLICNSLWAIQIMDEQSNIASFPIDFINQSDYFRGMTENKKYKQPFLLPLNISTTELYELFEQLKSNFIDVPLEKLTQYFVLANALLFNDMQKELLRFIYTQLQQLPNTMGSVQAKKLATKKVLRKILALPQDNFDEALYQVIHADELDTKQFQKDAQRLIVEKYPSIGKYTLVFGLPLPKIFGSTKSFLITDNPDEKIIFWGNSNLPSLAISHLNTFFTRHNQFDWNSIYLFTLDRKGSRLYINPNALIALYYSNARLVWSIVDLSSLSTNKEEWSHAAFSCDGSKVTATKGGLTYLIDYKNNHYDSLNLPHKVFSSILLEDDILLYRTVNGKTYLYNLKTKTAKELPKNTLDYYIVVVPEDKNYHVYGLEKTSSGIKESSEYITT